MERFYIYYIICIFSHLIFDILQFCLDFPRVSIGPENPLRIEEGDTAVIHCQVSCLMLAKVLYSCIKLYKVV